MNPANFYHFQLRHPRQDQIIGSSQISSTQLYFYHP
jgi:hypothetical protein